MIDIQSDWVAEKKKKEKPLLVVLLGRIYAYPGCNKRRQRGRFHMIFSEICRHQVDIRGKIGTLFFPFPPQKNT